MAMVKAKNITWDVVDGGAYKLGDLGNKGYLEEMDFNVIDVQGYGSIFCIQVVCEHHQLV